MAGRTRGLRGLGLAAAGALLLGGGCDGGDSAVGRPAGRADEYRARAEALETQEQVADALEAYRDAARRFPTQAWPWAGTGRTAARLGRFGEALEAFDTAVRWDSTRVDERLAAAEILREEGRADEALERIDEAVRRGGETAARSAARARTLAEAGRLAEARHAVDRALAIAPDEPTVRVAHALVLFHADSTTQALAELDALALDRPDEPETFSVRARLRRTLGDADGACNDLRRALAIAPRRPRDRLELARRLLDSGDAAAARESFRLLLEDNPRDAAALEGLGSCALATGDPAAAEEAFERAIESDPELAPAYLALGRFRREQGRLEEAVALFRKGRARASLTPRLWEECGTELAETYLALGEARNAVEVTDAILARCPDSESARALRGRALAVVGPGEESGETLERIAGRPGATREEMLAYARWLVEHGDPERSRQLAERVLSVSPDDGEARVVRAEALGALGRTDEAEHELLELLDAGVLPAETHLALARLYLVTRRLPEAAEHGARGEALRPDDPDFAVVRGIVAMQRGEPAEARAAFERERELRPESPKAWLNLGKLALAEGDAAEAVECFTRAAELDPDGWLPLYHRGLALAAAGRPREAIEAYREVLARDERVAEAHNNLAWLLADLDLDPVLAEAHARRAAELAPGNASVLGTLGWALYKNRLLDEAAVSLKEARRLAPDDPMKRYLLGVVELSRGETDMARLEIEEALRLDPAFERAASARELLAGLR